MPNDNFLSNDKAKSLISICICTYKRPHLLAELLESLRKLETENTFYLEIVIVDNDKNRTAEPIVRSFLKNSSLVVKYAAEERKNISLARNMAIKLARGDLIAFIDDDEIPDKIWLLTLYKALLKHNADAVMGPVLPIYKVDPPKWVIKGNFFRRPTHPTGFFNDWTKGRTGNLLIRKSLFNSSDSYFDPAFGMGGEDQDLTRRLIAKGYRFYWCNEAIIHEIIPPDRWKLKNMIKKAFIRGKMSAQYPGIRPLIFLKSISAIFIYMLSLPLLSLVGCHLFLSYLIKIGDHAGRFYAILFNKKGIDERK